MFIYEMQGGKGNWSWIWGNGKLKGCRAGSWLFQSEWRCGERRPKRHHRNTIHIKPVASRNPTPHLPSEASHGFQIQHEPPRRLIPSYFISKRRSHRQGGAGQESRQQIGFLRALVERREGGRKSYLLPLINGVYLKVVVVDSHSVIRVFWGESELDGGVEKVKVYEVKLIHIRLFHSEFWLGGMKDEPEKQYEQGNDG